MEFPLPGTLFMSPPGRDPFDPLEQAKQVFAQSQILVARAEELHREAQQIMSQALWCDQGAHAFSARDPGRQEWVVREYDDDAGAMVEETRTACSECARQVGAVRGAPKTRPAQAIAAPAGQHAARTPEEAQARGYDPDYVAWLEQKTHGPIVVPDPGPT